MAHALFLAYYYRYSGDGALAAQLLPLVLANLAKAPQRKDWPETAFIALNIGALEAASGLCTWLEQKDQIFCDNIAAGARRERAATNATHRGINGR